MNNRLLITDSVYQKEKLSKKNIITFEMNYMNVNTKVELDIIRDTLMSYPVVDPFKVIEIDISLYSLDELKSITSYINPESTDVLFYYYLKRFDDKINKKIETFLKKEKFQIIKKVGVDLNEVSILLQNNNLDILETEFLNEGNMDNVSKDIEKISSLDDKSFYKDCLTDSFESNIFQLIEAINNNNGAEALKILNVLDENPYVINLMLLNHFILLKSVLDNRDIKKVDINNGGSGKAIHPYRLKLLQNAKPKININSCIQILLENEITKKINLEMTILKILK